MSYLTFQSNAKNQGLRFYSNTQQAGFSILEVLIALVILSFGMLGAVGMQATAMQTNKETRNQSTAISLARELADKMRGNHIVAINQVATGNPYLIDIALTGTAVFAASGENCFITACTAPTAVATWDMDEWLNRVRNALPDPKIKICFDKTPFDNNGKPQWACTGPSDIVVLKMAWTRKDTDGSLKFSSATTPPLVIVPLTAGTPN